MTGVLFVTVDAGGNLPPALAIAQEIRRRGGSARFLGDEAQRSAVENAGFAFESYATAPGADAGASGRLPVVAMRQARAFADRRAGRDAIASWEREPADVVVVDTLLAGAIHELVDAGLPVVSLVHTMWSFFRAAVRGPFGVLIRLFGGGSASAAFARAPRQIVTARLEFERTSRFPAGVEHVGVVWQGVPVAAVPEKPQVLVSFSTTRIPGQERALQSIIDALADLPVAAIVTTGPAIEPTALRPAGHVEVRRYVDHAELLPATSLVVGHGGHGTTLRALAHGIPVLVLPMNPLIDQPWIAKAIERLGVGRALPSRSTPETIRTAIVELLGDGSHRDRARELGSRIRDSDGAVHAADILEEVAALSSPQSR